MDTVFASQAEGVAAFRLKKAIRRVPAMAALVKHTLSELFEVRAHIAAERQLLADVTAVVESAPPSSRAALRARIATINSRMEAAEKCLTEMESAFKRAESGTAKPSTSVPTSAQP